MKEPFNLRLIELGAHLVQGLAVSTIRDGHWTPVELRKVRAALSKNPYVAGHEHGLPTKEYTALMIEIETRLDEIDERGAAQVTN